MSVRYPNECLGQYVRQYLRHHLRYYRQKSNFVRESFIRHMYIRWGDKKRV